MSTWVSGDTLDAATLNARMGSAATVGGFSTNTLIPESGNTITFGSGVSNSTLPTLVIGSGSASGAELAVQITGNIHRKGMLAMDALLDHVGNQVGVYLSPTHRIGANNGLLTELIVGCTAIEKGPYTTKEWVGIRIDTPLSSTGTGSITSSVGLAIQDITSGVTNYGIYTEGTQNRFGGTSRFTSGSAVAPGIAMDSEVSLGFYRSAASTIAQSYGTMVLPNLVVSHGGGAGGGFQVGLSGSSTLIADISGVTLGDGPASNVYLFGGSGVTSRTAQGVVCIHNCGLVPSAPPTNGGVLFVRNGALLFLGGSNSLTTVAVP